MQRYICVHGHYYQPPRENPWLEAIEVQDSAYPFHDWNERITAQCYAPNAASRILDGEDRIIDIVNNYAKISFNFGPTLMAWLEHHAADVYGAILEADRLSQERFSGHGSAMAQAYNHMILPLANRRDKYTQILWGIRDFERRFGRKPEGMWLPETAADLESLDIMAEHGIAFTVLAPGQAARTRPIGDGDWTDVSGGNVNPRMPYTVLLPSGQTIAVFFYDGPIAQAVAFEGLLTSGETFAQRLVSGFPDDGNDAPQLVHIATDGETYGHHHRHGDMALAYALHHIETENLARLTNYGEYLEQHPPTHEAEVVEQSSWSCVHGVERWRGDCGCSTGGHPRWNQAWRGPLRAALDWLRDAVAASYEEHGRQLLKDPWAARDDYIGVVLDRSPERVEAFLNEHATRPLEDAEATRALKLLEFQRHAMLMYTSCGWFFDELSRIETVQVIQYAGRALQLAQELFGDSLEDGFLDLLEHARSNIPQHRDGRLIYEKFVKPAVVDWGRVCAHYAVDSLFEAQSEHTRLYSYVADLEDYQSWEAGRAKLAVGRIRLTSEILRDSALMTFGVLHHGDHNVNGGVRSFQGEEAYQQMVQEMREPFATAEFVDVIRLIDQHFGESTYSLRSLFRDEQRRVLDQILETTLADAEVAYRHVYEERAPLMRFLVGLGMPLPKAFQIAAEFFLNTDLRQGFKSGDFDDERVKSLVEEARVLGIELDAEGLGYHLTHTLESMMEGFVAAPEDLEAMERLLATVSLGQSLPIDVNLWKLQNSYYVMRQTLLPQFQERTRQGDGVAQAWLEHFTALGHHLMFAVD